MKRIDFIARQDRVVHILLIVTAAIGLTWVLWRHQYLLRRAAAAPVSASRPAR